MASHIFQAAFVPSRFLRQLIWILMILSLLLFVVYFSGWRLWLLCFLCFGAGVYALQSPKPQIELLNVRSSLVLLRVDGQDQEARLLGSSMIYRYFCFLHWQVNEQNIYQCVLPDMLSHHDFRRLRVWAKFAMHNHNLNE